MNIELDSILKLKDSVDIYRTEKNVLIAYFINSRKEIELKVPDDVFKLI